MAFVNMKCRSCGATLEIRDGYCRCGYCGSVYFKSVNDSPRIEAETLSLEEFEKSIENDSSTLYVNRKKGTLSDADADLTESKLKAAEKALHNFEFYRIKEILRDIPSDSFDAARILFLSAAGVRNEAEMCLYAGDLSEFEEYGALLSLCDEETKNTYLAIEKKCAENAHTKALIRKGYEFIKIKEFDDALAYAKTLISAHPYTARAWELLIAAKCFADENYDPSDDMKKLEACPDFVLLAGSAPRDVNGVPTDLSPVIRDRFRQIKSKSRAKGNFFFRYLLKPLLVLIAIGALIGIWKLIDLLLS